MNVTASQLLQDYQSLSTGEQRLEWLIERVPEHGRAPQECEDECYRVRECISALWLVPSYEEGRCYFRCRARSQVVEAVAALICDLASDRAPADVLRITPELLPQFRLEQMLGISRRMVVARVVQTVEEFARRMEAESVKHAAE